jgi:hypothetical protein
LNLSLNSDDDDVGDRLPRAQLSSSLPRPGGGEKNKKNKKVGMYCDTKQFFPILHYTNLVVKK